MTIGVTGHFHLESVEIEVGEHAVVGTACIVEWELELEGILVGARSKSVRSGGGSSLHDSCRGENGRDFV